MDNQAVMPSVATEAMSQPKLWVLEAKGTNVTEILNRAREILSRAAGITLIDEPAYHNGVLFEKDDSVAHVIDPKDVQWGYTLEGGEIIRFDQPERNKKKEKKNRGKHNKKKTRAQK